MEVDAGLTVLRELIPIYERLTLANANEAETRKKVIDDILERVLRWDKDIDISYEERTVGPEQATYADYTIRTDAVGLVVEAKRVGKTFSIPNNSKSGKLGGFLSVGDLGEAINQVRSYALSLSLQYCVVSNGSAFIVFPAFRSDSIPWADTRAVIFRSLDDIKERFVEFWSLLSRQRVIEGGLEDMFFPIRSEGLTRRLISIISEPGYRLGRNSVYEHIESAITAAFTDEAILNDSDGLESCYIKTTERIKYDSRLRVHLSDAKPQLERKVNRPLVSPHDDGKINGLISSSTSRPPQFILVLGSVGVGKTTFLHYTRSVSSKDIINKSIPWLYIDFKKSTEYDDPKEFVYKEILSCFDVDETFELSSWERTIKPAYKTQIDARTNGVWQPYLSDTATFERKVSELIELERNELFPYVERILSHVGKSHTVFVVIDNVDQIIDVEIQSRIFLESQALAKRSNCSIIVSLRESTYLKYRNTPVFDAFQVDAFYIDPPNVLPAISRSFNYAKQFLCGKKASIRTDSGILIEVTDLGGFLDSVSASLLSETSGPMLEILSAGDVRRGLALVREFLKSAHAETDRVIPRYGASKNQNGNAGPKDKRFDFPAHEVFKGCVLGQRKFYREEESLIINIFDSKIAAGAGQLLRLRILRFMSAQAEVKNLDGYPFDTIIAELSRLGFDEQMTKSVIGTLVDSKALRNTEGGALTDHSKIVITRLGAYMLRVLSAYFTYVEFCCLDSAIYNDSIWNDLSDITAQIEATTGLTKVKNRIRRVRQFIEYIRLTDSMWCVAADRIGLEHSWKQPFLAESCEGLLKNELDRVLKSAEAGHKRRSESRREDRHR